jgi:hypothetical protein
MTVEKEGIADAMLHNYLDPDQLKRDLDFSADNMNEDLRKHSQLQNHYANLAVRARAQSDRWESAVEVLESQLDNHYRKALKEENPKTTEAQIRAAIVSDARWKAATARRHDARTQWKLCENAARSFDHRKDMILQVARNLAREQERNLSVGGPVTGPGSQRDKFLAAAAANQGDQKAA